MRIHDVTIQFSNWHRVQEMSAISEVLCCRVSLTWSGTRNKGTSMKQRNRNGVKGLYAKDKKIMVI